MYKVVHDTANVVHVRLGLGLNLCEHNVVPVRSVYTQG